MGVELYNNVIGGLQTDETLNNIRNIRVDVCSVVCAGAAAWVVE